MLFNCVLYTIMCLQNGIDGCKFEYSTACILLNCVLYIVCSQNGHVLGEDGDIVDLWNSGLVSYSNQRWQQAVDMIEEAVHLYDRYRDQTLACIRQCYQECEYEEFNMECGVTVAILLL